jgi:hypothetical protein
VEQLIEKEGIDQYDWIVMADVVEHFSYPDEILATLVAHARPGACFLLSTPNVAHLSIRLGLMSGHFDYVESGILESTHLRFFTLSTLMRVLQVAGLATERVLLLNRPPAIGELLAFGWVRALILPFLARKDELAATYQFLVVARKAMLREAPAIEHVGPRDWGSCYRGLARECLSRLKRRLVGAR